MNPKVNRYSHHFSNLLKLAVALAAILTVQTHFVCHSIASVPVKVGIHQNEPKVYLDHQGNPVGFSPEILNFIAAKEDWELEYIPCTWDEYLNKVERGTSRTF